jgi:cysteine desulfurase
MNKVIYFDNNSTTHLLPEVKKILQEAIEGDIGNPESLDRFGKEANVLVEQSRLYIASLLSTSPNKLLFTSSGSESNTIAIYSAIKNSSRRRIVCSQIEHTSIQRTFELLKLEDYDVQIIRVLPSGTIDLDHAETLIDENTALVSVQLVNNETGVIQPIQRISECAESVGAKFHCDGAQAIGKISFSIEKLGCDYFTFTAHKIHGPKGIGCIWTRGKTEEIFPLIPGGSQEQGRRGGTHNVLGIIGFGIAAKIRKASISSVIDHTSLLRDTFEEIILRELPSTIINGKESPRVSNTTNMQFSEIDGKALFLRLLQQDIICSQSSACTAQYPEPSKILRAMGLTYEEAFNSIRFSFSELNTLQEVTIAAKTITDTYRYIQNKLGPGW